MFTLSSEILHLDSDVNGSFVLAWRGGWRCGEASTTRGQMHLHALAGELMLATGKPTFRNQLVLLSVGLCPTESSCTARTVLLECRCMQSLELTVS